MVNTVAITRNQRNAPKHIAVPVELIRWSQLPNDTRKRVSYLYISPENNKKMFAENQEIGGLKSDVTLRHDLAEP